MLTDTEILDHLQLYADQYLRQYVAFDLQIGPIVITVNRTRRSNLRELWSEAITKSVTKDMARELRR